MDFKFKGKKYRLPVTLNQITVRQKIEFDRLYRDQINEMYSKTFKLDDQGELEEMDEIEASLFKVNVAVMNISFFTGIPLQEVENEMSVDDVMNLYYSCIHQMYEEQENIELQETYVFKDNLWFIEPPYLNNESKTTFNQLVTSKQVIKQMQELSAGKYEAIPYLAAIYLRKEDEEFQEDWLNDGSERLEMMYDLPMDIANAIAFFLQNSMGMYLKTSAYSTEEDQQETGQI
ncbi:hypothetical protein [Chryseobacterium gambrini]|uniref:hypothetical protein n=1 Tax=Chryseobacterium gambrini TaxID=373672 RepID=UPI003D0B0527